MGHVADEADSQVWQHTGQCSCYAGSLKFMFWLIMDKCSAISLSGISHFQIKELSASSRVTLSFPVNKLNLTG